MANKTGQLGKLRSPTFMPEWKRKKQLQIRIEPILMTALAEIYPHETSYSALVSRTICLHVSQYAKTKTISSDTRKKLDVLKKIQQGEEAKQALVEELRTAIDIVEEVKKKSEHEKSLLIQEIKDVKEQNIPKEPGSDVGTFTVLSTGGYLTKEIQEPVTGIEKHIVDQELHDVAYEPMSATDSIEVPEFSYGRDESNIETEKLEKPS
jgi:hypothetical protein